MDAKQAKELLDNLTEKRNSLEREIAVETSKLDAAKESLKEAEGRVLELVGSTEPEKVSSYLSTLEADIARDQEKLQSMEKGA